MSLVNTVGFSQSKPESLTWRGWGSCDCTSILLALMSPWTIGLSRFVEVSQDWKDLAEKKQVLLGRDRFLLVSILEGPEWRIVKSFRPPRTSP